MRLYYRRNYPIFAMSDSKSNIAAKLDDTTLDTVKHIAKLCLYPEHSAVNHWKKEIYNFLHHVSTFKRTHKLPSKDFIYHNTYELSVPYIDGWIENVIDDYGESDMMTIDEIKSVIVIYYDWLSNELSIKGDVSKNAIYRKLGELIITGN